MCITDWTNINLAVKVGIKPQYNQLKNYFLDWTNFQAFAEDKLNVAKIMISVFYKVENIVGKGENSG